MKPDQIHFIFSADASITACGLFVSEASHTLVAEDVTCLECVRLLKKGAEGVWSLPERAVIGGKAKPSAD